MDYLLQDFRLAFRRLKQSPGFSSAAILTLALGIGANTTTFSALNQLILRPLPVEHPQQLVFLNSQNGPSLSYPAYKEFRDRNRSLAGLIAYRIAPIGMILHGASSHVWGYEVSGNYFEVLGVRALLGRALTPADDQKVLGHPVAVISYTSWQRRFAGDPAILGTTVKINGLDYTILGVMPRGFFGTELAYTPEFWVPMAMEPQIEPGNAWLDNWNTWNSWLIGRLKPGVTRPQAEAELNTIAAQLGREHPNSVEGLRIRLSAPGLIGNMLRGAVIGFASVLMAVAGLVLLIACTNLAGLLLARASDRRKEIAIRLALGAGKWRLVRQLLAESLLLSIAGAVAGLLIAGWLTDLLAAWRPPIDFPIKMDFRIDQRVLAFTAAAGLLTTLLFGLAPALQAAKTELVGSLKSAALTERLRRWQPRELLVTAQIGLSVVLLIGTVLVVRSLQHALTINIGFNPQNAAAVSFDLGLNGYSAERGREFQQRLIEKVKSLPGIQSAAIANSLPLGLDQSNTSFFAKGKPIPKLSDRRSANYYMVSPGYFGTMQSRFVAGRDFTPHDRQGVKPVVIVNRNLAERMFPGENPVGKQICQGMRCDDPFEIIGVVEDGKYVSLGDDPKPVIFWPLYQRYNSSTTLVARSPLPSEQLVRMMETAVHDLDPALPFFQAGSLDDHLRLPLLPARLAASMLGGFGLLAIVLAATGVYGIMAYAVSRRRREIGIRIAIGASRAQVLRLVLRRTAILLGIGTFLGAIVSLAAGNQFAPILYGVSPKDPVTFALAILLMAFVSLAAAWLPARRAMSIEPASALREE